MAIHPCIFSAIWDQIRSILRVISGQWLNMVSQANQPETGAVPSGYQHNGPPPATTYPIIADPVTNLDTIMLPTVGASAGLACDGTWVINGMVLMEGLLVSTETIPVLLRSQLQRTT